MHRITRYILKLVGALEPDNIEFDHIFYAATYVDLKTFKTPSKLYRHYVKYGRNEGRFANLRAAITAAEQRFGKLPSDFHVDTYKALNPDLYHFGHDQLKYIEHFLEAGRPEGRPYRPQDAESHGPGDTPAEYANAPDIEAMVETPQEIESASRANPRFPALSLSDQWASAFSVPDFLGWASSWLELPVTSRVDALNAFIDRGVPRLCPINSRMIFDPGFYRSQHHTPDLETDELLYRHWLAVGFPAGYPPNEDLAYHPYLGPSPFPESFDYRSYATDYGLASSEKLPALRHMFDVGYPTSDKASRYIKSTGSGLYVSLSQYYLVRKMYDASERALVKAISLGLRNTLVFHLLGDTQRELSKLSDALGSYQEAIKYEHPSFWSFVHGAHLAASLGRFTQAFAIAYQAKSQIENRQEYQGLIKGLIERYFSVHASSIHEMYVNAAKPDGSNVLRKQADNAMADVLAFVERHTKELFSFPTPWNSADAGHIVIFGNDDLQQCTHYRIKQKIQQLDAAGINAIFVSHHSPDDYYKAIIGAKAVIFYRIAAFPKNIHAILTAKAMGLRTYYEIDDLIFDSRYYPDTYDSYGNQISLGEYASLMWGVPLFKYAMQLCDFGIASTSPLVKRMEKLVSQRRCVLLPNALDKTNAAPIRRGQSYSAPDGFVNIFYGSGTKAHNLDFSQLVEPALLRLFDEFENVRLVVVGHLKLSASFDKYKDRITSIPFVANIDEYWTFLLGSSINIAALSRNKMSDCKSEIKWLEAASMGIPSVVSDTETYRGIIKNRKTGLLASSPTEWYSALKTLVVEPGLRKKVGDEARKLVLKRYSLEHSASILASEFRVSVQHEPTMGQPPNGARIAEKDGLRVLVCNVFFSPQSIGGATRVVEANVRYFQAARPDVELMVFCSDEGATPEGRVRFDHFGRTNVVRISTPVEKDMDWRPFNEDNRSVFASVVDSFRPDVIHFHCVQRLTATVLEVAIEKNIPYCVTVHDGWWIGDNQFLTDGNGLLSIPTPDVLNPTSTTKLFTSSVSRRIKLGALLSAADARLNVSNSFAQIYDRAGIKDMTVIENGIAKQDFRTSGIAVDTRLRERPLRLGHIGGRSAHKGAVLIEALLRRSKFFNLSLVMIDGRLRTGEKIETVWGTTPVILSGPYPQYDIQALYDSFDVLLAPSTWPESYGLVSREALACGKWVVASSLGAMGESVDEGLNGFLVDTANPDDLAQILEQLNRDHEKYKLPPLVDLDRIRSSDEQGEGLLRVYEILARRHSRSQ